MSDGEWVTVRQQDSVENLAFARGLFWETVWEHPENAALRETRGPMVLLPGDRLFLPALRQGWREAPTHRRTVFRRRGVPSKIRVVFEVNGVPQAGVPYVIAIDGGEELEGTTSGAGLIEHWVAPDAESATVLIGTGATRRSVVLSLRALDPPDSLTGVQARLRNRGYAVEVTGEMDDETRAALASFQADAGLEATGEPDDATRARLVELHGI